MVAWFSSGDFGHFFLYLSVYCEFVLTPKKWWEDILLIALSTSIRVIS